MSYFYDLTIFIASGSCRTTERAEDEKQIAALMPGEVLRYEIHGVQECSDGGPVDGFDLEQSLRSCVDNMLDGPPNTPFDPTSLELAPTSPLRFAVALAQAQHFQTYQQGG